MLCIEPFRVFSFQSKEKIAVCIFPSCRITKDPGNILVGFLYCNNGIFMSGRKKDKIVCLIVPETIIMEPVFLITSVTFHGSRLTVLNIQNIFHIQFPYYLACSTVNFYYIIFYRTQVRTVRSYQKITIGKFPEIMMLTARYCIFPIDSAIKIYLNEAFLIITGLQHIGCRHHQMTIFQLMNTQNTTYRGIKTNVSCCIYPINRTHGRTEESKIGIIITVRV